MPEIPGFRFNLLTNYGLILTYYYLNVYEPDLPYYPLKLLSQFIVDSCSEEYCGKYGFQA